MTQCNHAITIEPTAEGFIVQQSSDDDLCPGAAGLSANLVGRLYWTMKPL